MARKAAALLLPALLTAGLLISNVAPATTRTCPNTDTPATAMSLKEFNDSVFCLINQRRTSNGLNQLRPNGLLSKAAIGYARSMMAGRFFSHYGDLYGHDNAGTPVGRLRQMGYIRPKYAWIVGETLRWSYQEANT